MYNRYVPQPDGSYCRRQVQDKHPPQPKPDPHPTEKPKDPPKIEPEKRCEKKPESPCEKDPPKKQPCPNCPQHQSAGGFLRSLLPRDFDTGDLLIVLLLIIMAGDSEDGQNTALLTLALYFFM